MNRFWRALPTAVVLGVALFFAVRNPSPQFARDLSADRTVTATALHEDFSFEIKGLAVRYQGGNRLHLTVRYTYKAGIKDEEYPDFRALSSACTDYFAHDENESAYWEIVNKELTAHLLEKFPMLASVQLEISVAPTERIPWSRTSTVTRSRTDSSSVSEP